MSNPISRMIAFAYGVASYMIFLITFLYAIGFVGAFVVPKSLDSPPTDPWLASLLIDMGLLSLFAVQHSVMARPWFKRLLTRALPQPVERSTYVLASSLALLFLFRQWRPLGGMVWTVEHEVGRVLVYGGFALCWL